MTRETAESEVEGGLIQIAGGRFTVSEETIRHSVLAHDDVTFEVVADKSGEKSIVVRHGSKPPHVRYQLKSGRRLNYQAVIAEIVEGGGVVVTVRGPGPDPAKNPKLNQGLAKVLDAITKVLPQPGVRQIEIVEPDTEQSDEAIDSDAERVALSSAVGEQLLNLAGRLTDRPAEFLAEMFTSLDDLAEAGGTLVVRPDTGLTEAEIQALRDADSYAEEAPALSASARTRIAAARTLATSLTTAEAAKTLGVSDGRVRQRIAGHTLLAQRLADGWRLPAFQFPEGKELPGWAEIAPVFPAEVTMRAAERFMTSPHRELELDDVAVSPSEWLACGGDVKTLAELVEYAFGMVA